MPELSLCMPYFRNPRMLQKHMQVWRDEWPDAVKDQVEVVIVDDGSPDDTAAEALATFGDLAGIPPLKLYRVLVNDEWGQHRARNIAANEARGHFVLLTDMDHVVGPATVAEVLRRLPHMGKRDVLTFGRVDAPSMPWRAADCGTFHRTRREDGALKPHPNSFCMRRKHFWRLQGYNESFVGVYGCDQEFRTRLWKASSEIHLHDFPLIRVSREVIHDASTRGLDRKTPERNRQKKAVRARLEAEGRANQIASLTAPYERVL